MRYPFKAYKMKVDNHEFWFAECQVINGLIGQGDTLNEALEELSSSGCCDKLKVYLHAVLLVII